MASLLKTTSASAGPARIHGMDFGGNFGLDSVTIITHVPFRYSVYNTYYFVRIHASTKRGESDYRLSETIKKQGGLFMKNKLLGALLLLSLAGTAMAQNSGKMGLGLSFGDPTGLNYKYWMNSRNAFDLGVSFDSDLTMWGDYFVNFVANENAGGSAFFAYLGLGGSFESRDSSDNKWGIRIPVGAEYFLGAAPFSFYGELVPVFVLTPDTDTELDGSFGFRWYFN